MKLEHIPLFPSVVSLLKCEDFDLIRDSLITWIYEYQKTDKGVGKSNIGGWQSQDNFYFNPTFIKFYNYIINQIRSSLFCDCKFKVSNMWINVNKKGDYNASHDHPDSHISGVFWIQTPLNSGCIEFESPRTFSRARLLLNTPTEIKNNFKFDFSWRFQPEAGTILFFPSDLKHSVLTNESDENRISIAFNLWLEE